MKNSREEFTAGGKSLAAVKIQRVICTGGYKIYESQEKVNNLMYTDEIKLFAKNEKRIGNPNTDSEDIQLG